MTKLVHISALLLIVFCASCKGKTDQTKEKIKSETEAIVTSYGPNTMVRNVKQDRNGNILIAASVAGILRYDGKSFTNLTSEVGPRRFWDVLEDRNGHLWFASTDSGVYHYNGKLFQHFTTREGLANNAVTAIYEDRSGLIWFSTGCGISRYDGNHFQNFTPKEGHWNNTITTILEDKTGKLWVGTRGEAFIYNGKTFTSFKNKDGKTFNNVWSIIEDRKGSIWFGGSIIKERKGNVLVVEDGLWRYDGSTYSKVSPRGASAIIEDKKGNIWTTGSVHPPNGPVWALSRYAQKSLYDKKPTITEIMSIKGPGMLCGILEASDGSIWFGALGAKSGVYRYDGKKITDFRRKEDQT